MLSQQCNAMQYTIQLQVKTLNKIFNRNDACCVTVNKTILLFTVH